MAREREIEILMMDRCTRTETERHLKDGTVVFDGEDFERNFDSYMNELDIEEWHGQEYKTMIETKKPAADWGVVQDSGKTYYIMYML